MFLCLLIILLPLHYSGCSACFLPERHALLELKTSITRDERITEVTKDTLSLFPFLTWVENQTSDCCLWDRVECDNVTHRVTHLDLSYVAYHPSSSLNTSLLLHFEHLQFLDLSRNPISGWLTNEGLGRLSELRNLEALHLRDSMLNETTVASLNAITSLKALYLQDNHIAKFPRGICELEKLEELDLHDNKIEGALHPCLHNLTRLIYLDLSYNQLTGVIPLDLLSNMTSLEFISLSHNPFDGNVLITSMLHPHVQLSILHLSTCNLNISTTHLQKLLNNQFNLNEVDLSHNKIHGNYPIWLVENNIKLEKLVLANNSLDGFINFPFNSRKNMKWMDISSNQIQGKIPINIGDVFPNLRVLNLSANYLEGKIPTSLGNITNLFSLSLSTNKFSGEIPHTLRNNILSLVLSNNKLYGDLSPIFNITSLKNLDISNNQFTRFFPTNNIFPVNLITLDLSQNNISGGIPKWVANITNLESLKLGGNFINGLFPSEFCNLDKLQYLDFSENELSGLVPSCLNLSSLIYMHLERNKFSGLLPEAILNSTHLKTLDLNHNNFTGTILKNLSFLQDLSLLLLRGNLLSGSIPQELCELQNIVMLDLSSNSLSGSVPPCLSSLAFGKFGAVDHTFHLRERPHFYSIYPKQEEVEFFTKSRSDFYKGDVLRYMAGMDLSNNHFTGDIPLEFGNLSGIRALNLSHNQFTGSIPKTLYNLMKLESMDLSYNKLSGEIPTELIAITTLAVFKVAYNNLSGRIPDMKAQFSTFKEASYQGNPFLCGPPLERKCRNFNNKNFNIEETIGCEELWNKYGINPVSFLPSFIAAYTVYLLAFIVVLYINPYWRRVWFNFIDKCIQSIFILFQNVLQDIQPMYMTNYFSI